MPGTHGFASFTYQAGSTARYLCSVLDFEVVEHGDAWKDTRFILPLAELLSAVILIVQFRRRRQNASEDGGTMKQVSMSTRQTNGVHEFVAGNGGPVILAFKLARVLGSLALFAISVSNIFKVTDHYSVDLDGPIQWGLIATYLYTTVLASLSVIPGAWSQTMICHVNFVLLAALSTYVYRDIWPFATFDKYPADIAEGNLMWVKLGLLGLTGILIPLLVPRRYVPVDLENPMPVPNPEQIASIWSLVVYNFLDSIIWEAYRVPHLSHERLPPLCDYDYSKNLTAYAFPYLDPFRGANRDRHLFWSLMDVFFWEYVGMALCLVGHVLASFASPVAVNRILTYLESDDPDVDIRPWFWILWLFLGPLVFSATWQWFVFLAMRTVVRVQGILTELVFEHSLKIRFKAEPSGGFEPSVSAPPSDSASEGPSVEGEPSAAPLVSDDSSTVSGKGKNKADSVKEISPLPEQKKKDNLVGKINTLVTVDVDNIANAKAFLVGVLQMPLQLFLSCVFLYIVLGWSALVGIASIVILIPVPGYLASLIQRTNRKKMEMTDTRVEAVTQTVGVLRMVKLFGWEQKMIESLREARDEELKWLYKDKVLNLLNDLMNLLIPTVTMIVTYATYTLIEKQPLTPSKIFSSMAVFTIVRDLLNLTSYRLSNALRGKISLERIAEFLRKTELLDSYSEETCTEVSVASAPVGNEEIIGFNDATFAWSKDADDGTQLRSARFYRLKVPGRLEFKRNGLNLIVGPTGSGKTSILMALLGEMHFMPSSVDSWVNLPRGGGVAYAAQESWVQNETIKDNILFGSPYDEERYQKVIRQCALETDLKLFEAGDKTEVGEKGLTLSGGQKARVTLARAVYSPARILLLDDVLAALDVHTSKHIVKECLQGDLLRGRTVLLVTHNVALASPLADRVIAVGLDGVVQEVASVADLLGKDETLASEVEKEEEEAELEEQIIDNITKDEKETDGRLILAEEIAEGHVSWKSIMLYLRSLGGDAPAAFLMAWILGLALMAGLNMLSVWFLGYWGTQYENHLPSEVSTLYYLGIYTAILLVCVIAYVIVKMFYNLATQRASRVINEQLVDSVLRATLRWLDETPSSRIITRCTQDIGAIDTPLTALFQEFITLGVGMIVKLSGPVFFTPIFLLPGVLITILAAYIGNIYLKAQLSVKREMSNARAPMLAHFGAAITGLISIRAYGAEQAFKKESLKRIDHFTKVSRTSWNLNRWVSIRIDLLGATFTTALAAYLLVMRKINAANTGFSLNMSLEFCTMILYLVRFYNEFEVQTNSLERIQAYLDIDHEPKPTEEGRPPASWPKSGELSVEQLSARYSSTGPKVLRNLTFHVKSGERVGIVGRTGSGKSSLTLSLLRCILTEGDVYYDGLPTSKINLDALRSNITIIPQVPELLSGTLRRNLDPFEQHDDATLNSTLRAAGLFTLQTETDEARLSLDSGISGGGKNLSVGQRQIIALARAIVRNSKLLILDEATSAIDHKTDSIIQTTLRNELSADTTVLTIAHRLQTIMDADKVMVLDSGRIVEFDSPQALLQKKGGQFKALVDGSGDRRSLYAAAEQKASRSNLW